MREIKTWRDPYCEGWSICRPRQIELQLGLTVLVGCNGAGKTTFLHILVYLLIILLNIKNYLTLS